MLLFVIQCNYIKLSLILIITYNYGSWKMSGEVILIIFVVVYQCRVVGTFYLNFQITLNALLTVKVKR